ncbi:MAG TPA: hypothetical protein VNA04_07345 [Thermoanaerobaculia bacterium]|nr:hypothetical protein [Thermoanaerobaculia bacterium]
MTTRTRSTAAIGFAVLLVFSACATTDTAVVDTPQHVQVRPEETAVASGEPVPIPGPAVIDSEGRVYTSSSAGGTGNAATLGTNTNVNLVPEQPVVTETTVVETAPVVLIEERPMVSSVETETQTTTTRTRLSKD